MERLNYHVLDELSAVFDTTLVGPSGAAEHARRSAHVCTCPATPIASFLACACIQAVSLARKTKPRLVLAGSGVNAPPAWFAARASGAKLGVYVHGLDLLVEHFAYRHAFLPFIRRADFWLANSNATANAAHAIGLESSRVHLLHPGVAIPASSPTESELNDWRKRQNLGTHPLMLSVGRLTRRKGLVEFIQKALPAIHNARPDALLVVIGAEPGNALHKGTIGYEVLRSAAREVGLEASLRILGPVTDAELIVAYRAAAVHIFPVLDLPGDMEGFGMVAIEAAANGCPSVAFAVGGVPDAVLPGKSGRLIIPDDYASFASQVVDLLQVGRASQIENTCIEFAQRFSWVAFGQKLRSCPPIQESAR